MAKLKEAPQAAMPKVDAPKISGPYLRKRPRGNCNVPRLNLGPTRHVHSQFGFTFPRVANVAKLIAACAAHLGDRFGSPQIAQIPEQFDSNIPRAIFPSIHGFTTILISASGLAVNVTYSPDWQIEPTFREKHLKDALLLVSGLLEIMSVPNVSYSGLSCVYELNVASSDSEVLAFLHDQYLSASQPSDLTDLIVKITTVEASRYFSNVTVENFRNWGQSSAATQFTVPLPNRLAQLRGIRVTVEVNDRYAFNEDRAYTSHPSEAHKIVDLAFAKAEKATEEFQK